MSGVTPVNFIRYTVLIRVGGHFRFQRDMSYLILSGVEKSLPPWIRIPHGPPPVNVTVYELSIFRHFFSLSLNF